MCSASLTLTCIHSRHNTYLATVATGEHDEYSSRSYRRAQFPPVLAERLDAMTAQLPGYILCWIITGLEKKNNGKKINIATLKSS